MSKSPSFANIIIPAAGVTVLVLGVAYGVSNVSYGNNRIETLSANFEAERATVSEQSARIAELEEALADLQATSAERIAVAAEAANAAERQIASLRAQLDTAGSGEGDAAVASANAREPAPASASAFGIGRPAQHEEIAAWDVDVLPDGRGLPEGSGDVWTGEEVFVEKCASCHGDFAEGRDAWPVLAGGFGTLDDRDPVKTVGSYWPYLSTVWDYVHRSMPFGAAGTLTDDEVYAITAYILYSNDLVDEDFTLSPETFAEVEMPNRDGFIVDDRPAAEYPQWRGEPCISDCKTSPAEVTRRATDVGVTPADDGSMAESVMEQQLARLGGTEWGKERVAGSVYMGADGVPAEEPEETASAESPDVGSTADAASGPDPAQVAQGETVFRKCKACHEVGAGADNKTGPHLNDVMGRIIGGLDGYRYSSAFEAEAEAGRIWDEAALSGFLAKPKSYIEGTKMSFPGLKSQNDIDAIIAYLEAADG